MHALRDTGHKPVDRDGGGEKTTHWLKISSLSIRVRMSTRVSVKLAQPICIIQRNITVGRYQKFEGVLSRRETK